MRKLVLAMLSAARSSLKARRELALENLALRQQLAVLRRHATSQAQRVPLRDRTAIPTSGPGRPLWERVHLACPLDGHRTGGERGALALAEPLRRAGHRQPSAGVHGPRHRHRGRPTCAECFASTWPTPTPTARMSRSTRTRRRRGPCCRPVAAGSSHCRGSVDSTIATTDAPPDVLRTHTRPRTRRWVRTTTTREPTPRRAEHRGHRPDRRHAPHLPAVKPSASAACGPLRSPARDPQRRRSRCPPASARLRSVAARRAPSLGRAPSGWSRPPLPPVPMTHR
jgi:hypothetical protein